MKKIVLFIVFFLLLAGAGLVLRQAGNSQPDPVAPAPADATEANSGKPFYLTLDNEPAPVLSPEEALQTFHIAPEFEIELVAAEPMVEDPVAMAWDEHARLYVVEMRGYMPDAYGNGSEQPVGQIVRLEDVDGDGLMDKSEVFLGELVNPRAVAVVNEGILVAEPPNLWLCPQPRRESLCEEKTRIGAYAADVGSANVEHMENGLLMGLDNWIYNSKSSRRLRIHDGEIVSQEGLFRGQWGIAKDNYGRLLYNHNSTWIQADLFQAEDAVIEGIPGRIKGAGVNLTNPPRVFSVRVNPGVNRAYLDGTLREDGRLNVATGASGIAAYRGDQFPRGFSSDVFVPEAAGNVVAQFELSEVGMRLRAKQRLYADEKWGQRDFLGSTDERFRPVDASNGPDGALYIIDMYRGIIQDQHFLTEELRAQILDRGLDTPIGMGRIWRVRHTQGSPRKTVVLAGASNEELLRALSHDNGWVRDTAQRLLLASSEDLREPLSAIARGENNIAALHAIWTLHAREELTLELVASLVQMNDWHRQVQALRAGSALLTESDLLKLVEQLPAAHEGVQVQLAFALGEYAGSAHTRAALRLLMARHSESDLLHQAVVSAVYSHEIEFVTEAMQAGEFAEESKELEEFITLMGRNACLGLRKDISASEVDEAAADELFAFTQTLVDEQGWQARAFLKGFKRATRAQDFVPAQLSTVPALFTEAHSSDGGLLDRPLQQARTAFTWPEDESEGARRPLDPAQQALVEKGKEFYVQCAACHGADGKGVSGLAPALANASWVTGPADRLGLIILQGMTGPVKVNGVAFDGVMPPHGHLEALNDDTLAGLMTYLRRSFGNNADPVTPQRVSEIRALGEGRTTPWTAKELLQVGLGRYYDRYVGEYSVSMVTMTVSKKPDGLYFSVPMNGEGKLEPLSDTHFRIEAGGEKAVVEFVASKDGSVDKLKLYRKGDVIEVPRKD